MMWTSKQGLWELQAGRWLGGLTVGSRPETRQGKGALPHPFCKCLSLAFQRKVHSSDTMFALVMASHGLAQVVHSGGSSSPFSPTQ